MSVSVAVRTVFFVCVVSRLLYGQLPVLSTLVLFIFLLGVFAVGAPGVPGGTVLASLGIVTSVLGFDDAGTAMLIVILLCRIASAQLATSPVTVLWL
ncbi:cation:dicarboxylate symporter family transporter [Bacteroides fragilis]|uniref:cation:dicarboxylate symporter family transporter n=1 Tax=Bacteroides sp. TaxID=29523 RepID=UPI002A822E17|nr:cation:dicarboxylase symporter family transporter [Bacteroides sp.]